MFYDGCKVVLISLAGILEKTFGAIDLSERKREIETSPPFMVAHWPYTSTR